MRRHRPPLRRALGPALLGLLATLLLQAAPQAGAGGDPPAGRAAGPTTPAPAPRAGASDPLTPPPPPAPAADPSPADEAPAEAEAPGGATTVFARGQNAFSFPAANLPEAERGRFAIGNSFFKRNWVEAPASTRARDGLGPHFIARSCAACHLLDGRGAPQDLGRPLGPEAPAGLALLMRLSLPGQDTHGGPRPEPVYGDQLATAAVPGVRPEGRLLIRWQPRPGRFDDGTPYTLQQPVYRIDRLGYGPLAAGLQTSPRIAPQLIGVGLLEAIPEAEILANATAQAAAAGPIRGRPNRVWDAQAGRPLIGRFGWKANAATLAHQTAAAFLGDIGITSGLFPDEACRPAQRDCAAAPRGGDGRGPEIDAVTLGQVVFYQAVLAPPTRREPDHPQVRLGQRLFHAAQCASCHRPRYVTGAPPFPALSSAALQGQTIWPYTDLLLHDLGEDLADGRPDGQANGRQWKTPPLWGLGLIPAVNGHQRLLHDGRADGVLEAILWHGGEARASRDAVRAMSAEERAALVRFVESL